MVGNGAQITKYSNSTVRELQIPPTLGGRPVTGIGPNVFRGNKNITIVTIPDSVTSITFQGTIPKAGLHYGAFGYSSAVGYIGDLYTKYLAGGPGTYTRSGLSILPKNCLA